MKIAGLTMITNPAYRQDPWREQIKQMLLVFDIAVVVYGSPNDKQLFNNGAFTEGELERIKFVYLHWPQPEWSYEELAKHLNAGLNMARMCQMDWVVKLDIDMFIHENDRVQLYETLIKFKDADVIAATFEKYQFFKVDRAHEKGKIPLAINLDHHVRYGYNKEKYTDLCQPIIPDHETAEVAINGEAKIFGIPSGRTISPERIQTTGLHVWNYDYCFKTEPRARELLYYFDRSHARFWGVGYTGKKLDEITEETAFQDYVALVGGRIKKCVHSFEPKQHPAMIQRRVEKILIEEFGFNLWGIIPIPEPIK